MRVEWLGGPNDGMEVDVADGLTSIRYAVAGLHHTPFIGSDVPKLEIEAQMWEYPIRVTWRKTYIDYRNGRRIE